MKYTGINSIKLLLLFTFHFMFSGIINAQIKAITDTGDEVILYDDGTWEYSSVDFEGPATEIPLNPEEFKKTDDLTFQIKSKKTGTGVWINPKKWNFSKAIENPDAEYEFNLKEEDLYGIMITERLQIPIETLRFAAVENAKSVASDVKVEKEEFLIVNGTKVLMLQMSGNLQGMSIMYFGYYFSSSYGSIQLITYTSKPLMAEYEKEAEKFLNGFTLLEKSSND